jgi:hypothetical protein
MAFTTGSLFGQFQGNSTGNVANTAFNSSNLTNPNKQPGMDIFQILGPGGNVYLRVSSAGAVTTNVSPGVATDSTVVATYQMTGAQANGLGASPSAAQICAAAFPINYNNQQLDLIQIASEIASPSVGGGGGVVWRLRYNGATATS